jgi:hypothetical protein
MAGIYGNVSTLRTQGWGQALSYWFLALSQTKGNPAFGSWPLALSKTKTLIRACSDSFAASSRLRLEIGGQP